MNDKWIKGLAWGVAGITGLTLWIWTSPNPFTPYPLRMGVEAKKSLRYLPGCGISQGDFDEILRKVQQQKESAELITGMTVINADEVRIGILIEYKGSLAAKGYSFLAKKVAGVWMLEVDGCWIS
ncbi:MAG: hypothetical protein RL095_3665 [Verrucomicrobiota bacterium]|jgi:hypothetical protein